MNVYMHKHTHTHVQILHLAHMYTHTGREVRSTTKYKQQTHMQQKANRQMDAETEKESGYPQHEEPSSALFSHLYASIEEEQNTGWDERMNGGGYGLSEKLRFFPSFFLHC